MIKVFRDLQGSCRNCRKTGDLATVNFGDGSFQLCPACRKLLLEGLSDVTALDPPHGGKWFTIWLQDKENILSAMHRNLSADLDAGYSYTGQSIQKQLAAIDEYKHEFDEQLMSFVNKTNKEVENWCYYDLKKRGAIE